MANKILNKNFKLVQPMMAAEAELCKYTYKAPIHLLNVLLNDSNITMTKVRMKVNMIDLHSW